MMRDTNRFLFLLLALTGVLAHGPARAQAPIPDDAVAMLLAPAAQRAHATREMLLAAARAGERIVVVGDHGVILLSDDEGASFRQARSVPVSTTLTAVSFVDAQNGWAVGHGGIILHSADGGESWAVQHQDLTEDRPLFAVHFSNARQGVAAGLWSLLLITADGGQSWQPVALDAPPKSGPADYNLFALFGDGRGTLYLAAERGMVLRSRDAGAHWTYLDTGYTGSFWTGCVLRDGTVLVAGLRGTVYRSHDEGQSWQAGQSGTRSSITALLENGDRVLAAGLDGVQLESRDGGQHFSVRQREDSLSLTALSALGPQATQFYSKRGVLAREAAPPPEAKQENGNSGKPRRQAP